MPIYKMQGKKDGVQKYRVRINYTDNSGKPRQLDRVAYGAAEAKALEARLLSSLDNGDGRMTVDALFEEYKAVKKNQVRETTLLKSTGNISRHVLPELGSVKLRQLDGKALQRWKHYIEGKSLSIVTKKNIYRDFAAMLNYAVRMEYLTRNPLHIVGNFKDAYDAPKELRYYTHDQFKRFIAAARDDAKTFCDWSCCTFFVVAYYTGARKGEINALRWSDIEGDTIHIRRSITQKLRGEDSETPPKNKSSIRDIKMPLPLIRVLGEHKERQKQIKGFSEDFRVCGGAACVRDTTLDVKNRKYADLAGLPHIRIHDFRHSHASLLANEGINIQEIARRLGHSKPETTWNIYSHLYPREEDRAVAILNGMDFTD